MLGDGRLLALPVGLAVEHELVGGGLEPVDAEEVRREGFEPCVLETIVTIDAKGRVPWPIKDHRTGACAALVTVVDDATVEVILNAARESVSSALDAAHRWGPAPEGGRRE